MTVDSGLRKAPIPPPTETKKPLSDSPAAMTGAALIAGRSAGFSAGFSRGGAAGEGGVFAGFSGLACGSTLRFDLGLGGSGRLRAGRGDALAFLPERDLQSLRGPVDPVHHARPVQVEDKAGDVGLEPARPDPQDAAPVDLGLIRGGDILDGGHVDDEPLRLPEHEGFVAELAPDAHGEDDPGSFFGERDRLQVRGLESGRPKAGERPERERGRQQKKTRSFLRVISSSFRRNNRSPGAGGGSWPVSRPAPCLARRESRKPPRSARLRPPAGAFRNYKRGAGTPGRGRGYRSRGRSSGRRASRAQVPGETAENPPLPTGAVGVGLGPDRDGIERGIVPGHEDGVGDPLTP